MYEMTRTERIKAALEFKPVDKVPVSVWMHYSGADQDPLTLAKAQVHIAEKYEHDFIKLMPFGLYGVQDWGTRIRITASRGEPPEVIEHAVHTAKDWAKLEVLPGMYGAYGNQVLLAQYVSRMTKGQIPFVQTIFSPLTTARKMAGDRVPIIEAGIAGNHRHNHKFCKRKYKCRCQRFLFCNTMLQRYLYE